MDAHHQPAISPAHVRIPARTQRLAMEWGLVLASQAVEATIVHDVEAGWTLVVAERDRERALAAIKQYQRENQGWRWQQPVAESGLLFDWGSLAWVALMATIFWLTEIRDTFATAGLMNGTAVAHGEWWRLFTATTLHANAPHFASNAVFGFLLLGLAMGRYGTGIGLFAATVAGAGGNVASWAVHGETFRGLGASGVVMGALGLLAAQSLVLLRARAHPARLALGGIGAGAMLFVLLGLSPETDVIAHFGGFIAGIFLGAVLSPIRMLPQRGLVNLIAGVSYAALLILTWYLAFKSR